MSEPEDVLTDDEAMALGEAQMNEVLSGKGTVARRFKCEFTGRMHEVEIPVADASLQLKIMEYKARKKAAGAGEAPKKAKLTEQWFRDATDAELAEAFHIYGD